MDISVSLTRSDTTEYTDHNMGNQNKIKGVVVGKFYPPHKGHHYLINTALKNCNELTVIVCARDDQSIPGKLRAQWIKEVHPTARVILADDNIPDDGTPEAYSRAWADYTIKILGFVPDIAFTSEGYGERWCNYMGCKHFLVDMSRTQIPCSGTMIRNNPLEYMDFLEPPIQEYFRKHLTK